MSGPFGQSSAGGPLNANSMFGSSDRYIGGEEGGIARGPVQRFMDDSKAVSPRRAEFRNEVEMSTDMLEQRWPDEFKKAEERIAERQESWRDNFRVGGIGYDYSNDKGFQAWLEDKEERKRALEMHDLDEWLDDPHMMCTHGMRVFTALGIGHGVWNTYKVWTSIDRNYAKLNGVGLLTVASDHVPYSVLKGAGVGILFGLGVLSGSTMTHVLLQLKSGSIYNERRQWQDIVGGFATGGAFSAAAVGYMNHKLLMPMGHLMVSGTIFMTSVALGTYLGVFVYKPWQEAHPHNYKETPRAWNEKQFMKTGPAGIRGRWM